MVIKKNRGENQTLVGQTVCKHATNRATEDEMVNALIRLINS
jgi:hypothetical protein